VIVDYNNQLHKKIFSNEIVIWDETLRDGEQSPGVNFSLEEKTEIAKLLDKIGVGIIDLGFPSTSKEEQKTIRYITRLGLKAKIGVTVRANIEDIKCAIDCGVNTIFLFAPTSKLHIYYKFGMNYEGINNMIFKAIEYAKMHNLDVYFISEDTSRSDFQYIIKLFNQLYDDYGIDKIVITDTIGIMLPFTIKKFVSKIINNCNSNIKFGIHCHNDFGLATANTIAAIESGIVYPTVTVNGIGERAGNASFEETVMILEKIYGYNTGIILKYMNALSSMVELYSGMPVSPNKPIVGYNVFRHESGIHVNAMLKKYETYEPFPPETVGRKRELVFGKHTGRTLIKHTLKNIGITDEAIIEKLYSIVKNTKFEESKKNNIYHLIHDYYKSSLGLTEEQLLNLVDKNFLKVNKM